MPVIFVDKAQNSLEKGQYVRLSTVVGPVWLAGRNGVVEHIVLGAISRKKGETFLAGYCQNNNFLPSLQQALIDYFEGKQVKFNCRIDVSWASDFDQQVLRCCTKIPTGKTWSYQELARQAGHPSAARAVGGVMARNRIPVLIPCHRVIRSDGSLGGYSAGTGLKWKKWLLQHENDIMEKSTL